MNKVITQLNVSFLFLIKKKGNYLHVIFLLKSYMFCVIIFVDLLSLTIILKSNILYCLLTIDKYVQCNELKLKYNHKSDM